MHKHPMTADGAKKMRDELERLKSKERPRIIKAIQEARAHGDLKENAEYHAAKEEQGLTEGRIRELESKLSHAHVIDVTTMANDGRVIFGATITLNNLDDELTVKYQIVGEDEADLKHHKISVKSPIARAVVGKSVGDEVIVNTPQGEVAYEVLKVDYI